ncbi:hypothetical protein [Parasitella parasitica]|uniref:DH domain-containing protein n=1 Tax=Parasitella parasitica TaxID=35722 RepID=A0A0B7NIW7_9FUNG|nr:hypothetical protein [Parasitella parasitica]
MSNPNESTIIRNDVSCPYHQKDVYKRGFSNYSDAEISPEVANSYIQQNLPVRRQSLIVYHDKIKNENLSKQQQSDLPAVSGTTEERKGRRLHNSKSLLNEMHNGNRDYWKSRMPNPPLTIQITHSDSSADKVSSASVCSKSSPFELCMDTLFEEECPSQLPSPSQPRHLVPKFIGFLRPSKSETTYNYKNGRSPAPIDVNQPIQSWSDSMSQPLSRLRNVFSRLQTNTASANPNNSIRTTKPSVSTSVSKSYKDDIQYYDVFHGVEAVNCILDILCTNDRNLALLMGRALENQGLFHHVNYDYRLRDADQELYRFQYLHSPQHTSAYTDRQSIPSQFIAQTTSTPNKLLSLRKTNRKNAPSACETLPVNGVFSILTDCYSPTCTRKIPCYSISCPRMMTEKKKNLHRTLSSQVLRTEQEKQLRSLWRHSVPKNVVMSTNDMEKKRQECIYELIYTEEDFTRDMHYVQDFWIEPLLNNDIIPIERRHQFITDVFWNLADIERITMALSRDLTARQDKHSIIPCIGDILLEHVQGFDPFVTYGAHQIIGKHIYELEKRKNVKLLQFAQALERQPESRRLELNGYLTKPTSRLGRYNLLLSTIHRLTPKDHQDYETIPKVISKITNFMVRLNNQAGLSDNAFHLELISSRLIANKRYFSLDLMDPSRQLLMRGKMKRVSHSHSKGFYSAATSPGMESTNVDLQLFLFDNYLVFCKVKNQNGIEYYKVSQKPIPLEFLTCFIPFYNALRNINNMNNSISDIHNNNRYQQSAAAAIGYPITFASTSDNLLSITLIASTEPTRKLWLDKIREEREKRNYA